MMSVKKMFVAVGRLGIIRLNWSVTYMSGSRAGKYLV
jgi:hypothetical protein